MSSDEPSAKRRKHGELGVAQIQRLDESILRAFELICKLQPNDVTKTISDMQYKIDFAGVGPVTLSKLEAACCKVTVGSILNVDITLDQKTNTFKLHTVSSAAEVTDQTRRSELGGQVPCFLFGLDKVVENEHRDVEVKKKIPDLADLGKISNCKLDTERIEVILCTLFDFRGLLTPKLKWGVASHDGKTTVPADFKLDEKLVGKPVKNCNTLVVSGFVSGMCLHEMQLIQNQHCHSIVDMMFHPAGNGTLVIYVLREPFKVKMSFRALNLRKD